MTNKEAFTKAVKALSCAEDNSMECWINEGGGWGDMSTQDIRFHVEGYLRRAFKQPTSPEHEPILIEAAE